MNGGITKKQFSALLFTAVLSPLMRAIPRTAAAMAGRGAWLGAFSAFPALLALALLMRSLRRALPPGEGLGALFPRLLGPVLGRLCLLPYLGMFLLGGGIILRTGAERIAAAAYPQSRAEPFMLLLLAAALLIAQGALRAAARMAVVVRAVLVGSLGLVLLLTIPDIDKSNLLPLTVPELTGGLVLGGLPMAAAGGAAAVFSFLDGYCVPEPPSVRDALPHTALVCALAGLLCLECTGTFGAGLTARLSYPFFTLARDVSVWGLAQRIEAVVIALWVFADLIMAAGLLRCAQEAARLILRLPKPPDAPSNLLKNGRWLLWLSAGAALAAGLWAAGTPERYLFWSERLTPFLGNILVFGGFPLLWLAGRLRKKL